ncbi:MAG: hypothetical protein EXS42_08875 [Lacunisphaera sp.]|nr:hypothetical protein [Lacunisphaera sp.]
MRPHCFSSFGRLSFWAPGLLTLSLVPPASADLAPRDQAFETLRRVWAQEKEITRLRAGESLAMAGEGGPVRAELLAADPLSYPSPARVIALRVLAHAAGSAAERAKWIARIQEIFLDAKAPDRLHALESLAKLGVVPAGTDLEAVRAWTAAAPEAARPFGHWMLHLAGDPAAQPALLAALGSADPITRLRAGFALRMIVPSDATARAAVAAALAKEPSDSPARAYLLSAALRLRADPAQTGRWREEAVASFTLPGRAAATLELATVITHLEPAPSAQVFLALLDHPEADARIGGAKALLGQGGP